MPRANFGHLKKHVERVADVPGDFAEIGVWRGATFAPLAEAAAAAGRVSHAIDSFRGMDNPTAPDFDRDGKTRFPRGVLDAGGLGPLLGALRDRGRPENVRIWTGWIPEVFGRVEISPDGLAFVHVDVDQYAPTLQALVWSWPKISVGGILCSHDFCPTRQNILATAAVRVFVKEYLTDAGRVAVSENGKSGHIFFRKLA